MDYILSILHKMLLDLAINHRLTSQEIIWIWGSGFDIETIAGRLDASNPYFEPVIQVCAICEAVSAGSLSVIDGGSQALAISQKPVVVPTVVTPVAPVETAPVEPVATTTETTTSTATTEETASTTEASDTKASE